MFIFCFDYLTKLYCLGIFRTYSSQELMLWIQQVWK